MKPQINPPFDGSPPCPGCDPTFRGFSVHNILTRCRATEPGQSYGANPEGKAFVRLFELRKWHADLPDEPQIDHPVLVEYLAVVKELIKIAEPMTEEGLTIRWPPEVREAFIAIIPRAMAATDAYSKLTDAHFHDRRHATGEENLLRERQGSDWAGFINPDYEAARYHYTVEVVGPDDGDIVHTACGTGLRLHEYFKADIRRDPTFFGKVYCPACRLNAPWAQFENRVTA